MFTKIVVGVDGSAESRRAVDAAAALARAHKARIILVHVLPDPASMMPVVPPVEPAVPLMVDPEALAQVEEASRVLVEEARAQISGIDVEVRVEHGEAAGRLVDVVREGTADLLIVGSRGHSRLEEIFLGSVSEAVIRSAPCSVLVVR